jgi:hypothetical protein
MSNVNDCNNDYHNYKYACNAAISRLNLKEKNFEKMSLSELILYENDLRTFIHFIKLCYKGRYDYRKKCVNDSDSGHDYQINKFEKLLSELENKWERVKQKIKKESSDTDTDTNTNTDSNTDTDTDTSTKTTNIFSSLNTDQIDNTDQTDQTDNTDQIDSSKLSLSSKKKKKKIDEENLMLYFKRLNEIERKKKIISDARLESENNYKESILVSEKIKTIYKLYNEFTIKYKDECPCDDCEKRAQVSIKFILNSISLIIFEKFFEKLNSKELDLIIKYVKGENIYPKVKKGEEKLVTRDDWLVKARKDAPFNIYKDIKYAGSLCAIANKDDQIQIFVIYNNFLHYILDSNYITINDIIKYLGLKKSENKKFIAIVNNNIMDKTLKLKDHLEYWDVLEIKAVKK